MTTPIPADEHRLRLEQLVRYIEDATAIQESWDLYSNRHSDHDNQPLDEYAYGLRQRRRDAETWHAYERIAYSDGLLLDAAEQEIASLPAAQRERHWKGSVSRLRTAHAGLLRVQSEYLAELDALPATVPVGGEEHAEARAERNAEAWHYLNEWMTLGPVLIEIHTATQPPAPNSPTVAATPRRPHSGPATAGPGRSRS